MASLRASAPSSARPMAVTIAVALSALNVIANFAIPPIALSVDDSVSSSVLVVDGVLGVLGIVAAVGLWMLRKWGYIATIVVSAINLLLTVPEAIGGPYAWFKAVSGLLVIACIAIIVLVTRPEARRAYA